MAEKKAASQKDRRQAFNATLTDLQMRGARIEHRGDLYASVVWGRPVNHVLHLFISFITGSFWLIVWFYFILTGGETREFVEVNETGAIERKEMPGSDAGLSLVAGVLVALVVSVALLLLVRWILIQFFGFVAWIF